MSHMGSFMLGLPALSIAGRPNAFHNTAIEHALLGRSLSLELDLIVRN